VMAHAQKPDFVFRRNGRVHLNRRGRQFSRLLAVEVCVSAVIMLDTPYSEVVWRVLATHSIRQFPLNSPPGRHRVPSHFDWSLQNCNYSRNACLAAPYASECIKDFNKFKPFPSGQQLEFKPQLHWWVELSILSFF